MVQHEVVKKKKKGCLRSIIAQFSDCQTWLAWNVPEMGRAGCMNVSFIPKTGQSMSLPLRNMAYWLESNTAVWGRANSTRLNQKTYSQLYHSNTLWPEIIIVTLIPWVLLGTRHITSALDLVTHLIPQATLGNQCSNQPHFNPVTETEMLSNLAQVTQLRQDMNSGHLSSEDGF